MSITSGQLSELEKLARSKEQALRLAALLRLFVEHTDSELSDRDFIQAVIERKQRYDAEEIGDPSR